VSPRLRGVSLLALVFAPAVLAQEPKEPPRLPVTLPTVGTVIPLPKESDRRNVVVADVDAKGRIRIGDKAHTMDSFAKALTDASSPPKGEDGKAKHASELYVVLRLDRDLPWQAARWMLEACDDPKARVYRTGIAVRPEGAEEAAAARFLDIDLHWTRSAIDKALVPVAVKLEYAETEIPSTPADLYPFLKTRHADLDGKETLFDIETPAEAPTGEVLAAADAAIRHGAQCILLRGSKGAVPKDLPAAVAALPARKGGLVLTVLGTRVLPPAKDAPRLPPVVLEDGRAPLRKELRILSESLDEEIEIEAPEGNPPK